MPRDTKDSQLREDEGEREGMDAPRVDENSVEDEDRAPSRLEQEADEQDDEDLAEDIDLDDLSAMEGPDA